MIPHDDDDERDRCLNFGARNVLVRPLKRTELLFAARSLMNLRSLLRARGGAEPARASRPPAPGAPGASDERAHFFQFELFKRLLAIELKRSRRYGFPLSVLLVAPDGESILDAVAGGGGPVPGFDAGALTTVGQAVRQAVRDLDIPMQFAEETILVVMPHTDQDGALVVAERIRRKARGGAAAITVSIGVTSVEGARIGFEQLVTRATKALAQARRGGGDRVVAA
jgi:diguanylate cyclase (GGDEF)-like protein